jgi:acetyl/propionyl-CoA carboxylase alpha subunit
LKKLFVANRGEIAVRVIRAAREMGIQTVLGASEADAHGVAARLADEVVRIGPGPAADSYLRIEAVVEAAVQSGADAVHPGYGFLSERAEFVEACDEAGLMFVGPPASAMRSLGSKIEAKELARSLGIPLVPGFFKSGARDEELVTAVAEIGYPVMLKASAGGGGRGMRVVREPERLAPELALARTEALAAFGDGAMMVEKLIERPRHIEVQVLADAHGQVEVIFERECTLQRRHQKVLEEAPSPIEHFETRLWPAMREAATKLCLASGYRGAGTVEFIVNQEGTEFFFLEVNARLQVEHTVTEAISGVDLVAWQLRIAQGERLSLPKIHRQGHAIEVRILAEDPAAGFLPSIGKLTAFSVPIGPGVRVDTGYEAGQEVTQFYDSLLAKLIVWGETREAAIRRLRSALLDFHVLGVKTNISFLLDLIEHPAVVSGEVDTGWIGRELSDWKAATSTDLLGLGALVAQAKSARKQGAENSSDLESSVWAATDRFRNSRISG